MSETTNIELSEEAKQILADLKVMPGEMLKAIASGLRKENALTVSHIQIDYLNFPKTEPAVDIGLRQQSGRLKQSIRS